MNLEGASAAVRAIVVAALGSALFMMIGRLIPDLRKRRSEQVRPLTKEGYEMDPGIHKGQSSDVSAAPANLW